MESESGGRRVAALVRHGHFDRPEQTASAHQILPLSEKGREQARACAHELLHQCERLHLELDRRIESSQLLRSWETAQLIAAELEKQTGGVFEVIERDDLIERSIGSCTNLRFERISELLAADPRTPPLPEGWRRLPDFRLPVQGAESLMDAGRRVAQRLDESLSEMHAVQGQDRLRVFVAHAGCLRHAAVCLGILEIERVSGVSMDFAQAILLERSAGQWTTLAGGWKERVPESGGVG